MIEIVAEGQDDIRLPKRVAERLDSLPNPAR